MQCPKCRTSNTADSFYCHICGYKLKRKDKFDEYKEEISSLNSEKWSLKSTINSLEKKIKIYCYCLIVCSLFLCIMGIGIYLYYDFSIKKLESVLAEKNGLQNKLNEKDDNIKAFKENEQKFEAEIKELQRKNFETDNLNRNAKSITDSLNRIIRTLEFDKQSLNTKLSSLRSSNKSLLNQQKKFLQNKPPIWINSVQFANFSYENKIINDYGSVLVSSQMRFLEPKLSYTNLSEKSQKIKLYYKIIQPNGELKRIDKAPAGFTNFDEVSIDGIFGKSSTLNLTGIGRRESSTYTKGTYTYEIWYENYYCLWSGKVTIK
jgi:hypothetical protein